MAAWKKVAFCSLCVCLAAVGCDDSSRSDDPAKADPSSDSGPENDAGGPAGRAAAGGKPRAGSAGSAAEDEPSTSVPKPDEGATEFVSADPNAQSQAANRNAGGATTVGTAGSASAATPPTAQAPVMGEAAADASGGTRAVERGDIYRVLPEGRILNLNAYRGLQVIDIRDVNTPKIEGRLAVAGTPVEMYVVDNRAVVLLNDWQGYYGSRDDVRVERVQGGLVLNIDISDRAAPKLLSQAIVAGSISTSRLTQGTGQSALYVASTSSQTEPPYGNKALIKSFDVSGNDLVEKSEIDLGGYVQDVQATTDVLLVSSIDYTSTVNPQPGSTVSLVDISRPDGTMQRGGSVTARGVVANKFNMDTYKGVLRVVSGSNWNGTQENTLETFSISDLANPRPLDQCAFGSTEQLYATIFIENRAFFVTYFRQDPFHAFSIDDQGQCEEHNQFIVSGWNDFLRPTLNGTRLVGVGSNDEMMRRTVSVSLYDSVNLDNSTPLLARADLSLDGSYSEAQWDDRAFSVIENAVSVTTDSGPVETGLILVPFQGWNSNTGEQVAQVQILTFSDRTLTRRGVMDHGTPVRRSFLANASTAANLSDQDLSLYDIASPGSPAGRGRVEVAPNYEQLFVYGDHVARVHDSSYYFGYYGGPNMTPPAAQVEIVPRSGDIDSGAPVATIEVPATASLTKVGNLLVSTVTTPLQSADGKETTYDTKIDVFDLSDPTAPKKRGAIETDRIQPYYGGIFYPPTATTGRPAIAIAPGSDIACFDCWGPRSPQQFVVGDALVFAATEQQQKSLGFVEQCYEYPTNSCGVDPRGQSTCDSYINGQITCTTYRGQETACTGSFQECPAAGGECTPVDADSIPTQKSCSTYEDFRYWQAYSFDALDLRNPDEPKLADRIEMKRDEEGTSLIASDKSLYFNFQQPHAQPNDPRGYVKRFFHEVDFSDPQAADVGPAINVPGDVIAAAGDAVYTRDFVWQDEDVRTLVARLEVDGDVARLRSSRVFADRSVDNVKLDGAGHMLVSNGPAYGYVVPITSPSGAATAAPVQPQHRLTILDDQSLDVSGEVDIDDFATFTDAKGGRALFSVSGGLLVVNVEDPADPYAQAYFPTVTWPSEVYFDGKEAMFAGGPYGVYRFDTDVFNLLMK